MDWDDPVDFFQLFYCRTRKLCYGDIGLDEWCSLRLSSSINILEPRRLSQDSGCNF